MEKRVPSGRGSGSPKGVGRIGVLGRRGFIVRAFFVALEGRAFAHLGDGSLKMRKRRGR